MGLFGVPGKPKPIFARLPIVRRLEAEHQLPVVVLLFERNDIAPRWIDREAEEPCLHLQASRGVPHSVLDPEHLSSLEGVYRDDVGNTLGPELGILIDSRERLLQRHDSSWREGERVVIAISRQEECCDGRRHGAARPAAVFDRRRCVEVCL